jgi:hypothetical protein
MQQDDPALLDKHLAGEPLPERRRSSAQWAAPSRLPRPPAPMAIITCPARAGPMTIRLTRPDVARPEARWCAAGQREMSMSRHLDRRYFIGGSDARVIMGNDEAALVRLWREKRGELEREDLSENLIVQLGHVTEELKGRLPAKNTLLAKDAKAVESAYLGALCSFRSGAFDFGAHREPGSSRTSRQGSERGGCQRPNGQTATQGGQGPQQGPSAVRGRATVPGLPAFAIRPAPSQICPATRPGAESERRVYRAAVPRAPPGAAPSGQ